MEGTSERHILPKFHVETLKKAFKKHLKICIYKDAERHFKIQMINDMLNQ